jgi:hypothetical protein
MMFRPRFEGASRNQNERRKLFRWLRHLTGDALELDHKIRRLAQVARGRLMIHEPRESSPASLEFPYNVRSAGYH